MMPPYDPDHVEGIFFVRSSTHAVVARCSCGWSGAEHVLTPAGGIARDLADNLNAHRATYVQAVPA